MVVVTIEMKLLGPSPQDGQRSLVMACVSIEINKRLMAYKTPKHMNKTRLKGVRTFKNVKLRRMHQSRYDMCCIKHQVIILILHVFHSS
jgi:hypothetical protein